jgi:hypothetical protein
VEGLQVIAREHVLEGTPAPSSVFLSLLRQHKHPSYVPPVT